MRRTLATLFKVLVVLTAWLGPAGVGSGLVAAALVPLPERLDTPGSVSIDWQDGSVAHVFLAPDDRCERLDTSMARAGGGHP